EALRIRVADRLLHARRLAHRREDRVETPDPVAQPLEVGLRARRIDLLLEVLERRRYDGERRPELVRKLARERLQILRVLAKPLEQIREAARQITELVPRPAPRQRDVDLALRAERVLGGEREPPDPHGQQRRVAEEAERDDERR